VCSRFDEDTGAAPAPGRRPLYGLSPADPRLLAAVAIVLGIVAVAAVLIPAYRAVKVDPLIALTPE